MNLGAVREGSAWGQLQLDSPRSDDGEPRAGLVSRRSPARAGAASREAGVGESARRNAGVLDDAVGREGDGPIANGGVGCQRDRGAR
ncbi:MAG: hypothetical protein IPO66_07065 [Rhodanobacteraceae bacterium]|nr:hypothetical protein [Rhodanobacteraceae bacterium]